MTRGLLGYMVDLSSRLSKHTPSYDRVGRATDHTFGSDDAGNRRRMRWQYAYDDSNAGRLRAMASSNHDGLSAGSTTTATYDYNPSGDRVKRVEGAGTKLWSYDGHNIATAESSDNANVYSVYTVIGGGISNAVARHDVNASLNSTTSYYYQYNHRGDVVAALDSGGGYLYKYEYDAYGNLTTKWNSAGGDAPTDGILMTGKDYDEDTGLHYFNARWYDPDAGRFISEARLRPDREHPYVFCGNNPINAYDVSGDISQADFHDLCMAACLTGYVVPCLISVAGICLPCLLLPPPFGEACFLVCTAAGAGICIGAKAYNDCTDFCCWLERSLNI